MRRAVQRAWRRRAILTAMRAWLLLLAVATNSWAAGRECSLNGDGDVELCEKVYWRSRIAALAIPAYLFSTDGKSLHHGLSWTVAVDVPKDEWSDYFSLGLGERLGEGFP